MDFYCRIGIFVVADMIGSLSGVIDGKAVSNDLMLKLSDFVSKSLRTRGIVPCLRVILVGDDPASSLYVANKRKRALEVGVDADTMRLPADVTEAELMREIDLLNRDNSVHGILVQLPLPSQIDRNVVINSISAGKDVDGFSFANVGALVSGDGSGGIIPCTPSGCLYLLKSVLGANLSGLNAVVVGRSNIVGKPMFHLLLRCDCTVTVLHSRSLRIRDHLSMADIVVVAVGSAGLIGHSDLKIGAVVIDVGMNFDAALGRFVGDVVVDDALLSKVRAVTPVPGGVGPMTVAFLMINTVRAACNLNSIEFDFQI